MIFSRHTAIGIGRTVASGSVRGLSPLDSLALSSSTGHFCLKYGSTSVAFTKLLTRKSQPSASLRSRSHTCQGTSHNMPT